MLRQLSPEYSVLRHLKMQKEVCSMTLSIKSKNSVQSVGLIGVGTMGRCMLESLISNDFPVVAFDVSPAATKFIIEKGATPVASPRELAQNVKLMIMSLPAAQQVYDVINGEGGFLEALTPEHVIVDTSTVSPETSKKGARTVLAKGASYVDAPILGRPGAVGNWLLPAGGCERAIEYALPALRSFAKEVIRVGDTGAGNALKLLNQLMFAVINGITAEVLALTEIVGVDKKAFYNVIAGSDAATVSGLFKEVGGKIITEDYGNPTFTVELLCKDAELGIQMAKAAGVTPLIAGFVQILNENARGKGLSAQDTSAIAKMFTEYYGKTG